MDWSEFAQEVHQVAVDHGWWDKPLGFAEIAVMCHSELSEAVEEYRAGRPLVYQMCNTSCDGTTPCMKDACGDWRDGACELNCLSAKPEGVAVELADCIIRILDYLAAEGIDIDDFAPVIFCGGDTVQTIAKSHYLISLAYIDNETAVRKWAFHDLKKCISLILGWAEAHDVDMESVLRAKHEYNKGRPYRHGGKLL